MGANRGRKDTHTGLAMRKGSQNEDSSGRAGRVVERVATVVSLGEAMAVHKMVYKHE